MSRSVSAPSSVTNTSPCWNGLIVPGSTLMYGSNFWTCTFRPRAFSRRPSEAAVIPLPSDETTPPVTKTYFVGAPAPAPAKPARSLTARLRRAYGGARLRLPPEPVEVAHDGRPLDQLAQRAQLAEEVEPGQRPDRQPPAPTRETIHGIQA